MVKAVLGSTLLCGVLLGLAIEVRAGETLADVFDRVHRSVVVIRTTELDVAEDGDGQTQLTGVGSGVLITTDGKVLTADHLVHAASEIYAEFPGGERVRAACVRRRAPPTSRCCSSTTCPRTS